MAVRKILGVIAVIATAVSPAQAQLVVIDSANLSQAIRIAERTLQHYNQLRLEYDTILRMAGRLGTMDPYRIPAIPITGHEPGRWTHGRPWIEALNAGDARGTAYLSTTVPLQVPSVIPERMTASARLALERAYATIEIADSIAMMGAHQVGLSRDYHRRVQDAVEALEQDVLNPAQPYHEMTAVLDKIAAGELLARRQDMAANQLLSHALEQLLARSKRERDTEATTINMQLTTWRYGHAANEAFVAGTGDALRTWRQP
jgi:hypothetical protein